MTTKCVHEAIENCTPEAVENFLANIKVDFENCLSDVSCIVFTVTMLVTWLDPKSNCTYSSNVYLRLPGSAPKLSLVFQQIVLYSPHFETLELPFDTVWNRLSPWYTVVNRDFHTLKSCASFFMHVISSTSTLVMIFIFYTHDKTNIKRFYHVILFVVIFQWWKVNVPILDFSIYRIRIRSMLESWKKEFSSNQASVGRPKITFCPRPQKF